MKAPVFSESYMTNRLSSRKRDFHPPLSRNRAWQSPITRLFAFVNLLNIDKRLSSTIGVGTSARHSNLMVSSTLIPHGGWNISPTAKHVAPFAPSSLQGLHHYYEAICHRHGHWYFLPCVSALSVFSLSIPCRLLTFLSRACCKVVPPIYRTPDSQ